MACEREVQEVEAARKVYDAAFWGERANPTPENTRRLKEAEAALKVVENTLSVCMDKSSSS